MPSVPPWADHEKTPMFGTTVVFRMNAVDDGGLIDESAIEQSGCRAFNAGVHLAG